MSIKARSLCFPGGSADQVFLNHRLGWVASALLQSCSSALGDVDSVDAATTLVRRKETANSEQLYCLIKNRSGTKMAAHKGLSMAMKGLGSNNNVRGCGAFWR